MRNAAAESSAGPADSTSTSLLERVRQGDQSSWTRLAQIYGPLVYSWSRQTGLQDCDATDVVQEVFRAVHAHIATFRRSRPGDSFRGWLWTITRNKVRDGFRRTQREPQAPGGTDAQRLFQELPESPPESTDGAAIPSCGLCRRVIEAVRPEFGDRTWQAFWRSTVEGATPEEVAAELGVTPWAVYKARSRVLRRLRQELEGFAG